ncbi:hypothetical protein FB451DRAFT_1370796 [Mycena latifolia]|nr:hypothetical protein FB451DRAFT_1370796 [Mycena latifolia]
MQIPYALIFAVLFSVPTFAAPVANSQAGNEFGLEARKAAVKAKAKAVVKAKPVIKKPAAKPKKTVAPKKPAKTPVKPATKTPVPAKKPTATPAKKPTTTKATTVSLSLTVFYSSQLMQFHHQKKSASSVVAKKPTTVKPVAKKPAASGLKKVPTKSAAKTKSATAKVPTKSAAKAKSASAKKPAASACPIKPGAKKTKTATKKPKRMVETLVRKARIARRTLFGLIQPRLTEGNEFIGWHGTNEETAELWESSGEIVRPVTKEGQTKGRSGLDAELGAGLYISDSLSVAESAAAINAKANNLEGKVCAIFARSSVNWRESRAKVAMPEILRGNAAIKEQERQSYISNVPGKVGRTPAVLIGPLLGAKNQLMIVEQLNPNFEAQCFDIDGLDSVDAQAFEDAGNKVSYTSSALVGEWSIVKEDEELAKATVAAIEQSCT